MHPDEYGRVYAAEEVHWWYRGRQRLVLDLLTRYLPDVRPPVAEAPTAGAAILDAGCGTGGMAVALKPVGDVTALDLFPEALAYCRRRGLSRLVAGSVCSLPFADRSFDAVVSLDVLYHAAVPNDLQAARELARVLRPGGVLVLNLPAYDWLRAPHDVVIHTARRYTRRRIGALVEAAGLEAVWCSHWNAFLFPVAASVRLVQRLATGGKGHSDVGPVNRVLNRLCSAVLAVERHVIARTSLPFGLSVIAVARRPFDDGREPREAFAAEAEGTAARVTT